MAAGCLHPLRRRWRRWRRARQRRRHALRPRGDGSELRLASSAAGYDSDCEDEASAALFAFDASCSSSASSCSSASKARVHERRGRAKAHAALDRSIAIFDERARHLEGRATQRRARALELHALRDRHRARLALREAHGLRRLAETLFRFMGTLLDLKLQVQQAQHLSDALRVMSEYQAIGQQLRELEERVDVERLMDDVRDGAERLRHIEGVLSEPLLDGEKEAAEEDALLDRELAGLAEELEPPQQSVRQPHGDDHARHAEAPAESEKTRRPQPELA